MSRSLRLPFVLAVLVLGVVSLASAHHVVIVPHERTDEIEGWGPSHDGRCDALAGGCRVDVEYGGPSWARFPTNPAMVAVRLHHHHWRAFASRRSGALLPFVLGCAGGLLTAPSSPALAPGPPPDLSPSSYPRRL